MASPLSDVAHLSVRVVARPEQPVVAGSASGLVDGDRVAVADVADLQLHLVEPSARRALRRTPTWSAAATRRSSSTTIDPPSGSTRPVIASRLEGGPQMIRSCRSLLTVAMLVAVVAAGLPVALAPRADAATLPCPAPGDHCYATGQEGSRGTRYTGVQSVRPDTNTLGISSFWGPAYQSMWLGDSNIFFELGTANCPGFIPAVCVTQGGTITDFHWYAYVRIGASSQVVFQAPVVQTPNRQFSIYKFGSSNMLFAIDGLQVYNQPVSSAWRGQYVTAGLEVYAAPGPAAVFPVYASDQLKYTIDNGSWLPWAGRDNELLNLPPMCGAWLSDTAWSSSRKSPC